MDAWNGWYHVTTGTYGSWLPGDPRGWRSRHHREHVEGHYKNPPPDGKYEQFHKRSQRLMKSSPVLLDDDEKRIAGQAMVEMLMDQGVELLVLSLDAVHCHLLARFGNLLSRQAVGRAKKHAYHILVDRGRQGRVWEKKCRTLPVRSRSHQLNVYQYILDHATKGAWVWTFKEGLYWRK